jgi:hypothetical protein
MFWKRDSLARAISRLELLQSQSGRKKRGLDDIEVFRDKLRQFAKGNGLGEERAEEMINDAESKMRNALSRYEQVFWFHLTQDIVESLEENIGEMECKNNKKIIFGTLGTGEINGQALNYENSDYYIVLIDDGTFTFANLLAKALASSMPLKANGGAFDIDRDPTAISRWIDQDEYSLKRFVELFLYYAIKGNPNAAPVYAGLEKYHLLTHAWRNALEFFILAHEFGHARLGHLDAAMHSPTPHNISHKNYAEVALNWAQEFEADRFGLQLTLLCWKNKGFDQSIIYAGIESFFHGLEMLNRTLDRFKKTNYADEGNTMHPPVHRRIRNLREALKDYLTETEAADAEELALLVGNTLHAMRDAIEQHVDQSMEIDGAKLHEKWLPKQSHIGRLVSLFGRRQAKLLVGL